MTTKLNIFNFSPMLHKGWRESAKVQKCNVALLHYCRIAQSRAANHFVRFAAMFLMLITMSVGQVWADITYTGGNIYFDNSVTNWQGVIQICGRQSSYTAVTTLNKIDNTNLYFNNNIEGSNWGGILGWFLIDNATSWGNGNFDENNGSLRNHSSWQTYGLNSGSTYLMVAKSASNGTGITTSYISNGYSDLNKKQTVKVMISTNGGASYSEAGQYYGTIKANRYTLNANPDRADNSEKTLAYNDSYATGVITSSITFTASATNSGYIFMGWGESSSATPDGQASKTYTVSGTKTIYAFYKQDAAPSTIKLDGNFVSGSWNYLKTMEKNGNVFTYTVNGLSAKQYEFCFKDGSNRDLYKANTAGVVTSHSSLTLGNSGASYYNFTVTPSAACNLTFTLTYNGASNIDVQVRETVLPTYTFTSGSTWYFDFTAVSGGANWPNATGDGDYDANAGGTVKETTFSKDVTRTLGEEWGNLKTATGGWSNIALPSIAPAPGQNCLVIGEDGKTATWGTYNVCTTGAPSIEWATAPADGTVGGNMTASVTVPGGSTVAWSVTSGDAATVNATGVISYAKAGSATIRATVTNSEYCTTTNYIEETITVAAACVPTSYALYYTANGDENKITDLESTGANTYQFTITALTNDMINNLYIKDDCGTKYGSSTAIEKGQTITLTTTVQKFAFQGAAQNLHWHFTFNASTHELSCDAQSEEEKAPHLIQFFNYSGGDLLQSGRVKEGQTPIYSGATPTRESDAEWDYTFERWEPAIYAADKDQDYIAVYTQTRRQYTLTWDFAGGSTTTPEAEYTHGSVQNGATIIPPANPTKSGAVFTGWSPAVAGTMPTANTTYTAQWKTLHNIYVEGRFGISDGAGNMTYTGSSPDYWNASSTNIKFAYDEETGYYKLETHRTVAELSSNLGSNKQYFHFKEGSTKYGDKNNAGNTNPPSSMPGESNVTECDRNFVFGSGNAAADDVVLWIDWDSKKFWYSTTDEQTYAVTINNGDHGTVTPNGEQQVGKSGISITATPDPGYSFAGWSVTGTTANVSIADASAASTTITASGTGAIVTATWAALIPSVTLSVDYSTRSVGQTATLTVAIENWTQLVCFEIEKDGVASDMVLTDNHNNTFTTPALEVGVYRFCAHLKSACDDESSANSDWKTVTVTEDLSTGWYVKSYFDNWTKHELLKKSGHAGESVGYYTYVVPANKVGSSYEFGPQKGTSGTYFKNAGTYTRTNSGQEWTFGKDGSECKFTPDVVGDYIFKVDYSNVDAPKVTITYPTEAANAYYIYLGQSYDLPAAYTWASVNGGLPIVGNTATGKELGHYTVTRTDAGGHSVDVDVYVYQYYVKHQWNFTGGDGNSTQEEINAAWVWRPMTLVDGKLTYTGTISNDNKGGNICWDYTYDWTGVYQLDDDDMHNFHPGYDNNSKMGYWGNGAHKYEDGMPQATTGATTWKADWASGLSTGQVADFTFVPTTPYNGTEEPTVQGGVYDCTVHVDEDICTVTFGSRSYDMAGNYKSEWTGANAKGSVTTNLGSTSGLKVIKGTKASFIATPLAGYEFLGWYNHADCDDEHFVSANAEYSVILQSDYTIYAKFQEIPVLKLKIDNDTEYEMTADGNGAYSYVFENQSDGDHTFVVKMGSTTWYEANMNLCATLEHASYTLTSATNTVSFSVVYHGQGEKVDVCVSIEETQNSNWFAMGDGFGGKWGDDMGIQFTSLYRGISGIYYQEASMGSDENYFRVRNGSQQYEPKSGKNEAIGEGLANAKEMRLGSRWNFTYDKVQTIYVVLDTRTSGTPKMWFEKSMNYHKVLVNNKATGDAAGSTFTLKASNGLVTNQFAENELYVLTITPADLQMPIVTVDGEEVDIVANHNGTYTYTGSMQDKDQNVVITYEALKPITIYVRNDAEEGGFAQSGCRPLLQYNKVGEGDWVQYGETTPMVGFQKWFTITLPKAFAQNVKIQFCAGKTEGTWWTGEYDWSSQVELSSAISKYCLSIDNYKEVDYKQMRLSTAECPEFNVELTVSGGEQVGAVATLKSAAKITEDETHKVNLNYYVSYDGAEYELINNSPLVGINETQGYTITRAGTYKYKVVATFDDGTQTWEAEAVSKTYTIEAVTLVMIPSANYVAKNTSLTLTPEITGLASNVNVTYSYSFSAVGLSVDDAAVVPATINVGDVTNGTYTIYTTLKMGDVAIASHACNIEVGNITVTLTHTPSSGVMASTVLTLTATTSGIDGGKTYSFTVKAATEAVPVTLATAQASNSIQYTVPAEDTYTFTVVVSDGMNAYKATDEVVVAAKDYYISYTSWSGYQKMNYCGNGVYTYYYEGKTKYRTSTNTASINTQSNGTGAHNVTAIEHPSDDNIDAIFSYNANRDELTIIPATTVMYRIKSETEHGTFYSNEVSANGKVSFYATPTATLTWQTYSKEHIDAWQDLTTPIAMAAFKEDNVYVANATVDATPALSNVEVYDGTYYIYSHMTSLYQTDIATVETDSYKKHKQFQASMTKFENLSDDEFYNHYWVEWVDVYYGNNDDDNKNTAISRDAYATVGNTINRCVSRILPSYTLPYGTNLRYGYSPKTNHFSRAFLKGAGDDFLQMFGYNIFDTETGNIAISNPSNALTLSDGSGWVYMGSVKCATPAEMKLISNYNNQTTYLLSATGSSATTRKLLGSTTTMEGKLDFMVIYDYKTNRIVTGWVPGDKDIDGTVIVDADILFIRQEQGKVAQLTMNDDEATISSLQRVMFVLELDRDVKPNQEVQYEISMPFDCKLSDVFGVVGYMDVWGIQRYDGTTRAKYGWKHNNWTWLDESETLKKGEGYSLSFDKERAAQLGLWREIDGHAYLRLYFPSTEKGFYMSQSTVEPPITYPNEPCNVGSEFEKRRDSNWKMIGMLGYTDVQISAMHIDEDAYLPEYINQEAPNFYYVYDENYYSGATGHYRAEDAWHRGYDAFSSYFVQFAGTINWSLYTKSEQEVSPAMLAIQARAPKTNNSFSRTTMEFHLNNVKGEEVDRTFIYLRKGATEGYDQNLDLIKITDNGGTRISTVSDGSEYVANALPIETDTVPVLLNIAADGSYSIAMQNVNPYVEPILWDSEMNTFTPMNMTDYEVDLMKGLYEHRFYMLLKSKQIPDATTSLEGVQVDKLNLPAENGTRKLMINGMLYLLRDGQLYDATGRSLK